ncbi:MAG: nucleotidyltransferase domain-containing protein [Desulfovermiculus sp.]|nr:nucleotidyltransferase domain-containing protein [Desulfovermiculus sp.]
MHRTGSMSDLPDVNMQKILRVLAQYPQIEEAFLFGSWAKGTAKPGSDIDIALKGSAINLHVLNRISRDLDEQLIPNAIDLCIYDRIKDPDVLNHIHRVGKTIYSIDTRNSDKASSSDK